METQLKIKLTSKTPWIKVYDEENNSTRRTLFDELARVNLDCDLVGPSENDLEYNTKNLFSISTKAMLHKPGDGNYSSIVARGNTISETYDVFFEIVRKNTQEGFCLWDCVKNIGYSLTEDPVKGKMLEKIKL